jgi:dienelactone hydrolase
MPSMIGAHGDWAASLLPAYPSPLSLQHGDPAQFSPRRDVARAKARECIAQPPLALTAPPQVTATWEHDGLVFETVQWRLPHGAPTEAWILKPVGATGRLPAVLALHDHGAFKFYGKEKIVAPGPEAHPLLAAHRRDHYGDVAWANELARRGYLVMVHDAFAFGSRRVRLADLTAEIRPADTPDADESPAGIAAYNTWAATHEHLMAKSLFSAGTTWPGVFRAEDQLALDVLCARPDVDPARVGCGGLSGGGLRTVFLAGLDDRIRCAVCVGMLTTWRDYLLHKSFTHTWMCYVPLLPQVLDYAEILGLRAPLPTLVQNTRADPLFTQTEVQRAVAQLEAIYRTASAPDHLQATWYDGLHKFDRPMQAEAFAWFDRWLG